MEQSNTVATPLEVGKIDCNDNNEHNPHNHCCDRCDKPTTDASVLSFFPVLATVTISKYFMLSIVNATMFLKS